ncbi:MAG: hypothetical protein D4R57_01065 [Verrucomicrobiales bacterium]|nr:MAG: hypothetical protein D4R57_01065 [Verrucomicrobiales bacterium]
MSLRYLPALSFDHVVSARTARQDKMEIMVHAGTISDDSGDVQNFLHYLGAPPSDLEFESAAFGRIFTRQRNGRPPFREQPIRKRVTRNQPLPVPLFSGMLKIRNPFPPDSTWTLDAQLSLNPTRFIRHQQFPRPISRLLQERPRFAHVFYDAQSLHNVDEEFEFALIDADNWLPDNRLWSLFASPRFWQRHLHSYLTGTVAEVRDDLHRAAEHAHVRIERSAEAPFSLLYVENYWEFYSDDPIGTVLALHPLLTSYAAAPVNGWDLPIKKVESDGHENSRRLLLQTQVGETLKIYAKTNRRVRFEVKHTLNGIRPFRIPTGGHTFATIEGLLLFVGSLASISAERVNAVLRHFRLQSSAPDGQHTVLKLIGEVQSAVQDPEKAFALLQILTSNGSLVVGPGNQLGGIFRAELARLVRQGVLRSSNRRYSVTPSYRQALKNMQESGIGFLLGTRFRRRPNSPVQPIHLSNLAQ